MDTSQVRGRAAAVAAKSTASRRARRRGGTTIVTIVAKSSLGSAVPFNDSSLLSPRRARRRAKVVRCALVPTGPLSLVYLPLA